MLDFKDKNVIVTGSARGIGKVIAKKFASLGANILLTDIEEESLNGTVKEFESEFPNIKIKGKVCDVSSYDSVKSVSEYFLETFSSIHILINNAGITKDNLLIRMKEKEWKDVIDINLSGIFNCTQIFSKIMIKQKKPASIVNVSSLSGQTGNAGQTNYSASKAGVIGFTKSCSMELSSRNIRVNAVAPGFIKTEMVDKMPEKIKSNLENIICMKRMGLPLEVANGVIFLCSDMASYITGHTLDINGGGLIPR